MKLDRNGTKKPLDFAKLDKAYKEWIAAGGDRSNPRSGEVGQMAARYLHWAGQQPASRKLTKQCELAQKMLDKARGSPTPTLPSKPACQTASRSSASSLPSPLAHIKNAVVARAQHFGAALNAPLAGSFNELQQAYEELQPSIREKRPLDSIKASRVLQLARTYLANHPDAAKSETQHQEKKQRAEAYIGHLEEMIKKDQLLDIEKQRKARFSPDLRQRTDARQTHAQALVSQFPRLNQTSGGTSERLIRGGDDNAVYRFVPLPTREADPGKDQGPQHAVLASILHRTLGEQTGLDLRFPCATNATLEGVPGVLIDEVNLPSPDAQRVPSVKERQRAVVGQWLLGNPSPTWRDIGIDALGQTFPRELPRGTRDLNAMTNAALGKGVPLPGLQPPAIDRPVQDTGEVLDKDLATRLLRVDFDRLAQSLTISRNVVDMRNAMNGVQAKQPIRHFAASYGDAIERMLDPLHALRSALELHPDAPLTTLLSEAADELYYRQAQRQNARAPVEPSPVTPVPRGKPRGFAERVKRGLSKLWDRLRPWKSTSDGRHPDRTSAPSQASSPAGTPLAR